MSSEQQSGFNPIILAIVAVGLIFVMKGDKEKKPDPSPDPVPIVVNDLAKEIAGALKDSPKGTAEAYAAFYDLCANVLIEDGTKTPVDRMRARMVRAKAILLLSSPEAFGDIVSRELKAFETGAIDRVAYSKAFRSLSEACRGAGTL